jgi:hypothetical protein
MAAAQAASSSPLRERQYEEALASYRVSETNMNVPQKRKQILRSNVVASTETRCGDAQAAAAVQDAKQCIALNPAWAKARSINAYIAPREDTVTMPATPRKQRFDWTRVISQRDKC